MINLFKVPVAGRHDHLNPRHRAIAGLAEDIKTADIEDPSVIGIWNGQIHQVREPPRRLSEPRSIIWSNCSCCHRAFRQK
jgi:hypothetical protein